MKKITAVIPTLLKNLNILIKLITNLLEDPSVEEIIVINNSTENFSFNNSKVRIITDNKNLYVNPSWNLGVAEAQSEFITLVNDDIIIPPNFCSDVLDKMDENSGILGIDWHSVKNIQADNDDIIDAMQKTPDTHGNIILTPVTYRTKSFGIMMFFNKNLYAPIPEDLKIFFGDDYIIHKAKKMKKQIAIISGKEIFHLESLSSKSFKDAADTENNIYKKHVYPWYKRIFYFYERDTHYVLNLLFMQFAIKKSDEL